MPELFANRADAGQKLAEQLQHFAQRRDVLVLGLPRGGVPVAFVVAQQLHVPLDILLVRKLGVPGQEELAMGAIASGGARVLNEDVINDLDIPRSIVAEVVEREQAELERRSRLYRGDRPGPSLSEKRVILIDDGLATGASMRAAIAAVRSQAPDWIVAAAPVGRPSICRGLRAVADEVVCVLAPQPLYSVGSWYHDFSQVDDDEVRQCLQQAWSAPVPAPAPES